MKILSILFILIFSLSAFGQEFLPDWQKIPDNFTGSNFKEIYRTLLVSPVLKRKGEFETTADYQKRINSAANISFNDKENIGSTLFFLYKPESPYSIPGLTTQYDADKQVLNVNLEAYSVTVDAKLSDSSKGQTEKSYNEVRVLPLELGGSSEYEGSNVYGAKRTVTVSSGTYYSVAIENFKDFKETKKRSYLPSFNTDINLAPEKAKEAAGNIGFLFVGKLVNPYYSIDTLDAKPTISRPKETHITDRILILNLSSVWIFNAKNGEILAKLKPKNSK